MTKTKKDQAAIDALFADVLKAEHFQKHVRDFNDRFGIPDTLKDHNLFRAFLERMARHYGAPVTN